MKFSTDRLFIIHLRTKFHVLPFNGSFVTTFKPKATEDFRDTHVIILHATQGSYYMKRCIFANICYHKPIQNPILSAVSVAPQWHHFYTEFPIELRLQLVPDFRRLSPK